MPTTMIADLINPEVMADMISAKISKRLAVTPFCAIDNTLQGQPGDTVTIPVYNYIGDAADIAEGAECETVKLTTSSTRATVKKAMKAVELTDEAVLSGYGDPVGETNNQLAKSIAAKVDGDAMDALYMAQIFHDDTSNKIKYTVVVDAVGVFEEELNTEKVMFVHPNQVTDLRKDADFIARDKYGNDVMMTGEIGMIANCRIVPSKRVAKHDTYYKFVPSSTSGKVTVVASDASTGQVNLSAVLPTLPTAKVGDTVLLVSTPVYFNPIVKLTNDDETEGDLAAVTIYLKRDVNVETERKSLARKTDISADQIYTAVLSNASRVVLARIKA